MGITRANNGYSAHIEGFLVVAGRRYRLAKTNHRDLVLVEPSCELAPGTEAEVVIIVDGDSESTRITLPSGVTVGQERVAYEQVVPF